MISPQPQSIFSVLEKFFLRLSSVKSVLISPISQEAFILKLSSFFIFNVISPILEEKSELPVRSEILHLKSPVVVFIYPLPDKLEISILPVLKLIPYSSDDKLLILASPVLPSSINDLHSILLSILISPVVK